MNVIVFDDNPEDRKQLVRIVNLWGTDRDCRDLIIREYDSIRDLKLSLQENAFPDLFFLDIMTPESTSAGFELAEKIHSENPAANIVFTTNSSEYWSSAFEIFALHYLMKPLQQEKIFTLMDLIESSPSRKKTRATILPGLGREEVMELDRILYLEAQTSSHRAVVFLTDGTQRELVLTKNTFSDLLRENLSQDFVQCHRSIIVNLNYVVNYAAHSVTLKNCPEELPIGKRFREEFIKKMIEHQKGLRRI